MKTFGFKLSIFFCLAAFLGIYNQKPKELPIDESKLSLALQNFTLTAQSTNRQPKDRWGAVRLIANDARQTVRRVEDLLSSIDFTRLRGTASFTRTGVTCGLQTCTIRLRLNQNTASLTPTIGSAVSFKNSFEIFITSSSQRVLALHFDDPTNLSTGSGTLFVYRPSVWSPTVFSPDAFVESRFSLESGLRTQVLSMSGGPLFIGGPFESWRARLTESLDRSTVGVFGRGRIARTRNASSIAFGSACSSPDALEYTVSYIFNTASPNQSTAKMNLRPVNGSGSSATASNCTALQTFVASENYATFNATEGFVAEGVAAASIPAGYPSATAVDAVETAFNSDSNYSIGTISALNVQVIGNAAP